MNGEEHLSQIDSFCDTVTSTSRGVLCFSNNRLLLGFRLWDGFDGIGLGRAEAGSHCDDKVADIDKSSLKFARAQDFLAVVDQILGCLNLGKDFV